MADIFGEGERRKGDLGRDRSVDVRSCGFRLWSMIETAKESDEAKGELLDGGESIMKEVVCDIVGGESLGRRGGDGQDRGSIVGWQPLSQFNGRRRYS